MSGLNVGQVVGVNIEDEIRDSYMAYAMSVIVGRALPDVRDGLKPVHRRILFAMHEMGNTFNRAYKKSARVVGNVIGKYHPHGDSAVYDALVRMAQDFNMRLPLVDGQGNFGSVDGDPPAAMRYTEVRMAKICNEMLADIERGTVDFQLNYDGSEKEPKVLPARLPNLLVNGSGGIAVGMATNIPPHNLEEILDAVVALMNNPWMTNDDLIEIVPGPDFPTAGIIYGREGIHSAYRTGRGVIRVRALTHLEEGERNGRSRIIVDELPYQVNKARLLEKIAALVREKRLDGIANLRDESDRQGMRVVIELKRDAMAEVVLNQLFKQTALQSSFGIIMLAIVNGQPQVLTLREMLTHFIEFRRDVVARRCIFDLRKTRKRDHILAGLAIALSNTDDVIAVIRASKSGKIAITTLCERFELSERQAKAILEMRLQRLTGMEQDKILEEQRTIRGEMKVLEETLASRTLLDEVIIGEFEAIRATHLNPRRTRIVDASSEISIEDLIAREDMLITRTHQNYIKRISLSTYESQNRGGKGKRGMDTKEGDFVEDLFTASTHSKLFIFTNLGRVFQLKVYQLPQGSRTHRGKPIINLLSRLAPGEDVAAVLPIPENSGEAEKLSVFTVTRNGVVKKSALSAYKNINIAGLRGVKIKEGDRLIKACLLPEGSHVLLASKSGKSIRFTAASIRSTGRATSGVSGINLAEGDQVINVEVLVNDSASLLTLTTKGFGKRTSLEEYRLQHRSGKGIITIKTNERNGDVVGIAQVHEDDDVLIITDGGTVMRIRVKDIREIGRNTQGVRVIDLKGEERVVALTRVLEIATEDDEDAEAIEDAEVVEGSDAVEGSEVTEGSETEAVADQDEAESAAAPTAPETQGEGA